LQGIAAKKDVKPGDVKTPQPAMATPMMRQYLAIKSEYPDAILFFRLGDFYEMFLDDAVIASRILDITLTSRNKGSLDEVPLCGIPFHSCQPYIQKLVENGYKVAVCEQVEDPKAVKGIVKREVVRVITPGLVTDTEALNPRENNYLAALVFNEGESWGLATLDVSTGEYKTTQGVGPDTLRSELFSLSPAEILLPDEDSNPGQVSGLKDFLSDRLLTRLPDWIFDPQRAEQLLCDYFSCHGLEGFGCAGLPEAVRAAGGLLHYVQETQKGKVTHLQGLKTYQAGDFMILDESTRRNLELTATLREGRRKGSLLGVLDRTLTAMGARLLKQWVSQPLVQVEAILSRQGAVRELIDESGLRQEMREELDGVYDLERLHAKVATGTANAKDLVALKQSLGRIPGILGKVEPFHSNFLIRLRGNLDPLTDVVGLLENAIVDDPPFVLRDGGLIKPGFNSGLDELRTISREGKTWIAQLEQEEKVRTGIPNLKIRFNKVFGYYLEVTKSHLARVPEDYLRKQTLANAERFITPALKKFEDKVLGAEERMVTLEYDLFQEVRQQVAEQGKRIQATAGALAALDVILSLADLAHDRNYVCPLVDDGDSLEIVEGRHPVVECMTLSERFVPNDVLLDNQEHQILIITGPNMAGKSTFMRQVALITLLAQVGSFVPAKSARIGVVDRIFTRVGASDNLAKGQSTFMVEMTETAHILNHASPRSLIVLDEIGRGTSTFDGISIAWAVAEYLHDHAPVAAKTLFATHYHELTDLPLTRDRARNYNIAVREWNDQIIFLRKIVKGGASHSYGIQVARLAGLPTAVIDRARQVLQNLEAGEFEREGEPRLARGGNRPSRGETPQLQLFRESGDPLRELLKDIDLNQTTPLQALVILQQLKDSL